MGWNYQSRPVRRENLKSAIIAEITSAPDKVKDAAIVGSACYLAVETDDGNVEAVVALFVNNHRDGFGVKTISEHDGPYETKCPLRILKLLSPASTPLSKEWRGYCEEYHRMRKRATTLKEGQTIFFENPLSFKGLGAFSRFKVVKGGTSPRFTPITDGGDYCAWNCRITNLAARNWGIKG